MVTVLKVKKLGVEWKALARAVRDEVLDEVRGDHVTVAEAVRDEVKELVRNIVREELAVQHARLEDCLRNLPTPQVHVAPTSVTIPPACVTVPEGAIRVEVEAKPSVVHVSTPEVNVPPPQVHVAAPVVNVAAPVINTPPITVTVPEGAIRVEVEAKPSVVTVSPQIHVPKQPPPIVNVAPELSPAIKVEFPRRRVVTKHIEYEDGRPVRIIEEEEGG